jgi:hypothetical protein
MNSAISGSKSFVAIPGMRAPVQINKTDQNDAEG